MTSDVPNLATRLTKDKSASTFNRLAKSQHLADLQLIFWSACVLIVVLLLIAVLGWKQEYGNPAVPIIAILGSGASVLTWIYQTGSSRLGIVDLFASEIATICRVVAIVEVASGYKNMYETPPKQPPGFFSQEDYTPVFTHNSKDLEVLEARVVQHVTRFYTYLKTLRDYLRFLGTIAEPQAHPDEWHPVYMLFLMLESGRESVRRLIEFEPEREENIITILMSEIVAYGVLLEAFETDSKNNIGHTAKLERLRLRKIGYEDLIKETSERVRSHMGQPDEFEWLPAKALLDELNHRYKDALGRLPGDA